MFLFLLTTVSLAIAKLNVVTTTTDLKSLVDAIAKDRVSVESLVKGSQDPHFLEAKPSFILKVSKADLVVANGLELEVAWLPLVIQGARNSKVAKGQRGYLEVADASDTLETPKVGASRADGDVHPHGNPHVTLDPIRLTSIADKIADRLSQLDTDNASFYRQNLQNFSKELAQKTKEWQERIRKSGVSSIVSYHKTLTYFFDRFGIKNPIMLEPKPGVSPSASHILQVIETMKREKISLVLVENYFDSKVASRIRESIPSVRIESVPVSVEGESGISDSVALWEFLVRKIEDK